MKQFEISALKPKRFRKFENHLLRLCNTSTWLGGGAIRSIVNGETPNDYDFFFNTADDVKIIEIELKKLGYNEVFRCPVGSLVTFKKDKTKVQLITSRFYNDLEHCISTFDFTVTVAGTDGKILLLHDTFLKDLKTKVLKINILTYPAATINRLFKYKKYGYATADAILDITSLTYERDPNILDVAFLYMD